MKKLFLILTFSLWLPTAHAKQEEYIPNFSNVEFLAKQGFPSSQYNLGYMYATGNNADQSYILAHMWYFFSHVNGYEKAVKPLNDLKGKMTQREIEMAKQLAGNCWRSNFKDCEISFMDLFLYYFFDFYLYIISTAIGGLIASFTSYLLTKKDTASHIEKLLNGLKEIQNTVLESSNNISPEDLEEKASEFKRPEEEQEYYIPTSEEEGQLEEEIIEDDGEEEVEEKMSEELRQLTGLAEDGDSNAQISLGIVYGKKGISAEENSNADMVKENYEKALKWFKKAAEQENPIAQYNLGVTYENAYGDYKEAMKWYQKAAEQNYSDAGLRIGYIYWKGEGVDYSHEKAVEWWEKAAEQGNLEAQLRLAVMYYNGFGSEVDIDYKESLKWFKMAAKQGYAFAQFFTGEIYKMGQDGVPQDYIEALKWYFKAAKQEYVNAQIKISEFYLFGHGLEINFSQAYMWAYIAEINEKTRGKEIINQLKGLLSKKEIEEAERMAKRYREYGYKGCFDEFDNEEE